MASTRSSARSKKRLCVTHPPPVSSITNSTTEDYLQSLSIPTPLSIATVRKIVFTASTRYERRYLESRQTLVNIERKGKRTSGRKSSQLVLDPNMARYKVEDISIGFSWWKNENVRVPLTQKEHNTSNRVFINGFNGELNIMEIAGPRLAYTFVVPFMTQFGLMSAFKTQPNDMLIRETMKELSSMKNCYYTQLHWRKGNGNSSHVNESDWRDNPLLDPTSSMIVEGYLAGLSNSIGGKTGWNMQYTSLCSLIETDKAGHQAAHLDDKGCTKKEEKYRPFILHHPLCEEGSTLQLWLPNKNGTNSPQFMHIPFGTALLLRGDVYHAGCYGSTGNIRFHAHFTPQECTADGRELGIMNVGSNERFRESDLPSESVNNLMVSKNNHQMQFTDKYLKRMKQCLPIVSFWGQGPEKNVVGQPKRTGYS
jgi:hypothetical protein